MVSSWEQKSEDVAAMNETSRVVDAINYIKELKHKVEKLIIEDMRTTAEISTGMKVVSVETLGKGFVVKVQYYSGKSCPGLMVSILEAFEELGLNVLEATVSCSDIFLLQAFGAEEEDEGEESINSQMVKTAISNAISIWDENNDQ